MMSTEQEISHEKKPRTNYLTLRIWGAVTISLPVLAATVRIVSDFTSPMSRGAWAMHILLLLAALGSSAFAIGLILQPNFNLLRGLPFRIGTSLLCTVALAGAILHFIRFVPPRTTLPPIAMTNAVLLLMAVGSAYLLVLWIIWRVLPSVKAPSSWSPP